MEINKYTIRGLNIQKEEAIDAAILEATAFDYPNSATDVVYETEEFTFVCPRTGLPDFARLVIRYTPDRSLVELKSLKYYLTSYRNVGLLQEHAVNRILHDLVPLLEPISMVVEADYKARGGLSTKVVAKYNKGAVRKSG